MAKLSTANRATVQWLVDYLNGAVDRPVDPLISERLAPIFGGTTEFPCPCGSRGISIQDSFRDEPVRTFLRILIGVGGFSSVVTPGSSTPVFPSGYVDLGAAAGFAVLAGSTITNTGGSVVTGDLGLSPGSAVTGFPPGSVTGTQHVTDTDAANAQLALTTAYNDAAGRTGATIVAGDIGGTTKTAGVYKSVGSLAVTSADLTLDAQGNSDAVFIFQIASTLLLSNSRSIVLANGAKAANVFWQVGSSATIGTSAIFKGTILALTSTTVTTSAAVEGRLLARNGAVTLDTNAVTLPAGSAVIIPGGETLTATSFAQIQALVDYLQGSPAWPVDMRVVEILDDLFGCSTDFPGACGSRGGNLRDALRDEPVRTFLRLLLILSDAQ